MAAKKKHMRLPKPKDYIVTAGCLDNDPWESRSVDSLSQKEAQVVCCILMDRVEALEAAVSEQVRRTEEASIVTHQTLQRALKACKDK